MSEIITEDVAVETVPVKKEAAKKSPAKPRATKKVAEETTVIENVKVQEGIIEGDEGQKVIAAPTKMKSPRSSNMQSKEDNILGSRAADAALARKKDTTKPESDEDEKVAIWSDKNIRWTNVGALNKGYNIVKKEVSDKWLARQGIRMATPEEVASYYGK